ncbi:MAG: ABC transporter substrate-binding protein [Gaiellaceae bacterium]
MRRRERIVSIASVAVLVVGIALFAAACGGKKSSNGVTSTPTTATSGGSTTQKTFPNFTIVYDTGTDYLDPALSYTVQGWAVMWNVYLSLLGYKHVAGPDGATIVPALATDLPTISSDGKTYTLTLRSGLKYSNGTPVKASDFKYAIKRDFLVNSPGGGFFTNIVGAAKFSKTMKGDIPGIVADDATGKITIKLSKPQGDFENILATIFAAPVPATTPAKDQSTTPIPSTGPYQIQSYTPNKQFIVIRNPNFVPTANVPATNPDKMTFKIVADDSAALQQVINGQADYDFHPIPVDRLADVQAKYGSQLKIYTPANTYYFFMNSRIAPFNKLAVRQAVNYAIDRNALVRLFGGLASPTENILPPTYPQYKKHDLYPYNLAKAKQLIKQAGATGMAVTVWGSNRETSKKPVAYLADVLNKIGLKASLKIIDGSIYWTTIGNQATKAAIGFADWFQDYPHPLDWFDVLLNGERITPTHNNNYADYNNKSVNATIDKLKQEPTLTDAVNQQWAALDETIMKDAPWAPYVNRNFTDFFSSKVDTSCYINHVLYQFDFSRICMK